MRACRRERSLPQDSMPILCHHRGSFEKNSKTPYPDKALCGRRPRVRVGLEEMMEDTTAIENMSHQLIAGTEGFKRLHQGCESSSPRVLPLCQALVSSTPRAKPSWDTCPFQVEMRGISYVHNTFLLFTTPSMRLLGYGYLSYIQ